MSESRFKNSVTLIVIEMIVYAAALVALLNWGFHSAV